MFWSAVILALHLLAAVIWVGGMFFAYVVLRPALGSLETGQPLKLWRQVFPRFFTWVWVTMIWLVASGYWMLFMVYGGFKGASPLLHVMNGLGLVMVALFIWLYLGRWPAFRQQVDDGDMEGATVTLGKIRHIIAVNLVLGLVNCAIGGLTPWIGI
ncbi:MAG: CopD family protein [Gammaproteobacteria bacterium]